MMIGYLTLAESLNDKLRQKAIDAKIYVWQHRYNDKLHGVEFFLNGKHEDVAVDICRRRMKAAVQQAYDIIISRA